jgi:hypothetical protein
MSTSIEIFRRKLVPTARSFKWEVAFQGYDDGSFFPCHVLNDTAGVFNNSQVEYGPWKFDYPEATATGNIDITIYELHEYSFRKWLEAWMVDLVDPRTWGVGLLGEIGRVSRQIDIQFLNLRNEPAHSKSVLVIPDGEVQYEMNSEKGGNVSVNMSLIVVGT